MKKFLSVILAAAIALPLAACSDSGDGGGGSFSPAGTAAESSETVQTTVRETTARSERVTTTARTTVTESETVPAGRPQRNGFDESTNRRIKVGQFTVQVPDYWEEDADEESDGLVFYVPDDETDDAASMIMFLGLGDMGGSVTSDVLSGNKEMIIDALKEDAGLDCSAPEDYRYGDIIGILADVTWVTGDDTIGDVPGKILIFSSEGGREMNLIAMITAGNTIYRYDDDFDKIIQSIEVTGEETTVTSSAPSGIRPEFKAALDEYEAFFDEYAQFMANYANSDDPFAMLTDYLEMLEEYSETMEALDELGEEEMSDEEALYYTEVMFRIEMKLLQSLSDVSESGGTEN